MLLRVVRRSLDDCETLRVDCPEHLLNHPALCMYPEQVNAQPVPVVAVRIFVRSEEPYANGASEQVNSPIGQLGRLCIRVSGRSELWRLRHALQLSVIFNQQHRLAWRD